MHQDAPDSQQEGHEVPVSRRGVLGTALLMGIPSPRTGVTLAAMQWKTHRSSASGASIVYPATWSSTTRLCPALRYPRESFALLSGPIPRSSTDEYPEYPDLRSFPEDGVVFSLLHYDAVTDPTPLPSKMTVSALGIRPTEFKNFTRYGGVFSSTTRTFLIRLWIGTKANSTTTALLNRSLASLRLP